MTASDLHNADRPNADRPNSGRSTSEVRAAEPRALRLLDDRISIRLHTRPVLVSVALLALLLVAFAFALTTGSYPLSIGDVLRALIGHADAGTEFIVRTLRLPRAVLALLAGAALGIAGTLFQHVTRNPLASPDVVGVQAGAATGALLQIIVFHSSGSSIVLGALIGGIAAVAVVLLVIPLRQAGGFRFVLVGIAVAALANGINEYMSTRTDLTTAIAAAVWQTGSLNGAGWSRSWPVLIALILLTPVALWVGAGLRTLALGDDLAAALGVSVQTARLTSLGIAVVLSATATAGAGPLLFVALAAGQIAQQLLGRPGPCVLGAALVGAVLVLGSDLAAQRLFQPTGLPAGVVTGVLGGVYLAFLLGRLWRH